MKVTEIEKLRQLISRTDMSGNEKVAWLANFINEREKHYVGRPACDYFIPSFEDTPCISCGLPKTKHETK